MTDPGGHYRLSDLRALEAQAIHIFREVAAEFERPILMFSGGKDSIVMLHLAKKSFWPAPIPFPVLHVDTGRNFDEVLEFRDRHTAALGVRLEVARVQDDIDAGRTVEDLLAPGHAQPAADADAAARHRRGSGTTPSSVGPAGTRRRHGPRSASSASATSSASGTPRTSAPSCGTSTTPGINKGEHIRVFPLSNWTELDVWNYIQAEGIDVPPIYFAHRRQVFQRDGMLMAVTQHLSPDPDEQVFEEVVRFRTVGDADCTGCVESMAETIDQIIAEVAGTRLTERGATRADDRISEAGMEDRKREGYF